MTNNQSPAVSVIIVSYNVSKFLLGCLKSLYDHQCNIPFEVIVVDNNSTDDTIPKVQENFPQVRLIDSGRNMGFAAANNLGATFARSNFLYLLNPDTLVLDNAIQELHSFLVSNQSAGAAGSDLKNPDGTLQPSCFPFPTLSREAWRLFHLDKIFHYGSYPQSTWDKNKPRKVDVIQGTSLMVKRSVWEKLGGFDDSFFMYSEEFDFCYRMKKEGFERFWVPSSKIIHFGGQSTSQFAQEMFLQLYRAKIQFFKKHYSQVTVFLYKTILLVASSFRLLLLPVNSIFKPQNKAINIKLQKNYQTLLSHLSNF